MFKIDIRGDVFMYKQKLCMGLNPGFGIPETEQIKIFKKAGFEGYFIDDCKLKEPVSELVKAGKESDIFLQSYHAPFNKSDDMWTDGEIGEIAKKELLKCVETCAEFEIPIMVTHAFIGYDNDFVNENLGVERYAAVAKRASELGVKLALENTEGQEYLKILMDNLKNEKNVGFCWDTGHELCYNYGEDMTALYGDRLICTHINDNLGISSFDGVRIWKDDLHLLPFDGITDWDSVAKRLVKCGYNDFLTLELSTQSKPERYNNHKYSAMPFELYVAEAYARACKIAALKTKYESED